MKSRKEFRKIALKHYEDDLAKVEEKGRQLNKLSQGIQAEQAHLAKKKRNLLIAAGLIAVAGAAAMAGALAVPALILVKAAGLATLAAESAALVSYASSRSRDDRLAGEKVGLDIRLEENAFQRGFKQRKIDHFRGILEQVREEDRKKLEEHLKDMPPESVDSLRIMDEGDFVNIGGIRLRKKERA
jgi:hypothetical protein